MIVSPLTGVNYHAKAQDNTAAGQGQTTGGDAPLFGHELAASAILGRFDADGSGDIGREEAGLDDAVFDRIDADGDGVHSLEEITRDLHANPGAFHPELARRLLEERDSDGDGVSLKESGLDDALFHGVDTDNDGVHSMDEIVAHLDATLRDRLANAEHSRAGLPGVDVQQLLQRYQQMQDMY
jgi:hypothetical protein